MGRNFLSKIFSKIATKNSSEGIISNECPDGAKIERAVQIISGLQLDLEECIKEGHGPFVAAIYDCDGNLVAKSSNSVVNDKCSHNHAEINVIREAERVLDTYNLAPYNLKLYVTSEPCMMCLGAIMWSGIKEVYYGVPSPRVEKITGFDEGFKPDWLNEFKNRGITVYGNILPELGEEKLKNYVSSDNIIYRPNVDDALAKDFRQIS